MITIYGDKISGNCLKVKYVAELTGQSYEWVDVSVVNAQTRTPEFLKINPFGQVPAIKLEDGRTLSQSNAIMRYLAAGSGLIPSDPFQAAKMDEWLFWEQYSHEPTIAVTRFHVVYQGRAIEDRDLILVSKGEAVLDHMEAHLSGRDWFVGDALSLADIALYAYTQFAPDAGFSLKDRPAITAWLARVRQNL